MTELLASVHGAYPHAELPLDRCGGGSLFDPPCLEPVAGVLAYYGNDGTSRIYLAPRCEAHLEQSRTDAAGWPMVVIPQPDMELTR